MGFFRSVTYVALMVLSLANTKVQALSTSFISEGQTILVTTVAQVDGIPWGMDFVSPSKIIFTQKSGKVGLLDLSTQQVSYLKGAPAVADQGQGGLLDIRVAPDFATTNGVYLSYAKQLKDGKTTALARAKLKGDELTELQELFVAKTESDESIHFGSRIGFDRSGHLFLTIGDRGKRERALQLNFHNGKVIRLKLDGQVPSDNPFVDRQGALPEIWSYGHRNPQGLVVSEDSTIFVQEHGPRGGDEINILKKGANYGWPEVTYGREYYGPKIGKGPSAPGVEEPLKQYTPSIAPCGMVRYSGKVFQAWRGDLLSGALVLQHLNRLDLIEEGGELQVKSEERFLEAAHERIRNVVESPDGLIYLSTDSGKILRLAPAPKAGKN